MDVSFNSLKKVSGTVAVTAKRPVAKREEPEPFKNEGKELSLQYKTEDLKKALFQIHDILDATGRVTKNVQNFALIDEEKQRLLQLLNRILSIRNKGIDFDIDTSAVTFLEDIILSLAEFQMVGSGCFQALGVSFCKRLVEHLLKLIYPDKDSAFRNKILEAIFTPDFVDILEKKLNKKLADVDFRTLLPRVRQGTAQISEVVDRFTKIMLNKLKTKMSPEKRNVALAKLKEVYPDRDWSLLTIEDPYFEYTAIKYLAFAKIFINPKVGDQFGIVSIGDENDILYDLVIVLDLLRDELFPSVKLPCTNLIRGKTENEIYPAGKHWLQAVFCKMCGYLLPDINIANDSDLRILFYKQTCGEVNGLSGSEQIIYFHTLMESQNRQNRIIRKILKTHPEYDKHFEDIFPHFMVQMLKEVVATHLHKNSMSAVAVTINAIRFLINKRPEQELDQMIKEMAEYWNEGGLKNYPHHVIFQIAEILTLFNQPLEQRLALIKTVAFLRCQSELTESSDANKLIVYPRVNAGVSCVEVGFETDTGSSRTFLIDVVDPTYDLQQSLKLLNSLWVDSEKQKIEKLIISFLPEKGFKGPASSPLYKDLKHFTIGKDTFENIATSCLMSPNKANQLLGVFTLLALQAMVANKSNLNKIILSLPAIVYKLNKHAGYFLDNLSEMTTPSEKRVIAQMKGYSLEQHTDREYSIFWLQELLKEPELALKAYQHWMWHTLSLEMSAQKCLEITLNFINDLMQKGHLELCLRVLLVMNNKNMTPLAQQLKLLETLVAKLKEVDIPAWHLVDNFVVRHLENIDPQSTNSFRAIAEKIPSKGRSQQIVIWLSTFVKTNNPSLAVKSKLKPEEVFENKIKELEYFADNDADLALKRILTLNMKSFLMPLDRVNRIFSKLVRECLDKKQNKEMMDLFRSDNFQYFYKTNPEAYMKMAFLCLESNQEGTEEINMYLLETLLGFYNTKNVPIISSESSKKFVTYLLRIFTDSRLSRIKLSDSFIHVYKSSFSKLFNYLSTNNCPLEVCQFFDSMQNIDAHRKVEQQEYVQLINTLNTLINQSKPIVEIAERALSMRKRFELNDEVISSELSLLTSLIKNGTSIDKILDYFKRYTTYKALDCEEELELVIHVFKKFRNRNDIQSALQVMSHFTGTVENTNTHSQYYLTFIQKLTANNQTHYACQALFYSPFSWNETHSKLISDQINLVSQKLLAEDVVLSCEYLIMIFTLLENSQSEDAELYEKLYKACEGFADEKLSMKMWETLLRLSSANEKKVSGSNVMSTLQHLRHLATDRLYPLLQNDDQVIELCLSLPSAEKYEAYLIITKCWFKLIKAKKNDKKVIQAFEVSLEKLNVLLQDLNVDQKLTISLRLQEFYLVISNNPVKALKSFTPYELKEGEQPPEEILELLRKYLAKLKSVPSPELIPIQDKIVDLTQMMRRCKFSPFVIAQMLYHFVHFNNLNAKREGVLIVRALMGVGSFSAQEMDILQKLRMNLFMESISDNTLFLSLNDILEHKKSPLFFKENELSELHFTFLATTFNSLTEGNLLMLNYSRAKEYIELMFEKYPKMRPSKRADFVMCSATLGVVISQLFFKNLPTHKEKVEPLVVDSLNRAFQNLNKDDSKFLWNLLHQFYLEITKFKEQENYDVDITNQFISHVLDWVDKWMPDSYAFSIDNRIVLFEWMELLTLPSNVKQQFYNRLINTIEKTRKLDNHDDNIFQMHFLKCLLTKETDVEKWREVTTKIEKVPLRIAMTVLTNVDIDFKARFGDEYSMFKFIAENFVPRIQAQDELCLHIFNHMYLSIHKKPKSEQEECFNEAGKFWMDYVIRNEVRPESAFSSGYEYFVEPTNMNIKFIIFKSKFNTFMGRIANEAPESRARKVMYVLGSLNVFFNELCKKFSNNKSDELNGYNESELFITLPRYYLDMCIKHMMKESLENTYKVNAIDYAVRFFLYLFEENKNKSPYIHRMKELKLLYDEVGILFTMLSADDLIFEEQQLFLRVKYCYGKLGDTYNNNVELFKKQLQRKMKLEEKKEKVGGEIKPEPIEVVEVVEVKPAAAAPKKKKNKKKKSPQV